MIEQHLRILYSKVKVGYLLARLRELRRQWIECNRQARAPAPQGADWYYRPEMFGFPPDGERALRHEGSGGDPDMEKTKPVDQNPPGRSAQNGSSRHGRSEIG